MRRTWPILLVVAVAVAAYVVWQRQAPPAPARPAADAPSQDLAGPATNDAPESKTAAAAIDPATGLRATGDWELVRANCIACHSARLITQQRGTRTQWLGMIRWMQAKQNLWQFEPDTEEKIVAYLAENYAPRPSRRRAPIPPDMMPPNPFPAEVIVSPAAN